MPDNAFPVPTLEEANYVARAPVFSNLPNADQSRHARVVLKTMPDTAQARYRVLVRVERNSQAQADASWNHQQNLIQSRQELQAQRAELERDLKRYASNRAYRAYREGVEADIQAVQEQISEIEESLAALRGSAVISGWYKVKLDRFLAGATGCYAEYPIKLTPRGSRSLAEMYDIACGAVGDFEGQISALDVAPLTREEAVQEAIANLNRLAARGEPEIDGLFHVERVGPRGNIGIQGSVRWPMTFDAEGREVIDAAALAVWANYDSIKSRLLEKIETRSHGDDVLSMQDRKRRRNELTDSLRAAQREMIHWAFKLHDEGHALPPLPDVPASVLLGIEKTADAMPEPVKPTKAKGKARTGKKAPAPAADDVDVKD